MEFNIGKDGLETDTFQEEFPEVTKCVHCGKNTAHIAFTAVDDKGEIRNLKKTFKGSGLWIHDSVAYAVYHCTECLDATVLWNQA